MKAEGGIEHLGVAFGAGHAARFGERLKSRGRRGGDAMSIRAWVLCLGVTSLAVAFGCGSTIDSSFGNPGSTGGATSNASGSTASSASGGTGIGTNTNTGPQLVVDDSG